MAFTISGQSTRPTAIPSAAYVAKAGDTMTGSLLFSPDSTDDIGAAGATRPRNLFLGRNAVIAGPSPWIDITAAPYSVVMNSNSDQSAGLQAAFNAALAVGARVYIPPGSVKLTVGVTLGDGSAWPTASIIGSGKGSSRIDWYGSTSGVALTVNREKQYILEGFTVQNNVARGTTEGIWFTSTAGSGTQNGSCTVRNILVTGFHRGFHFGAAGGIAVSEVLMEQIGAIVCDVGIYAQDQNTLDYTILMLSLGECGTGVQFTGASCLSVHGGSASGSTVTDFDFGAYDLSIIGFRSETANRFLTYTPTGTPTIGLYNCDILASTNADGYLITAGNNGNFNFIGNRIFGKINFLDVANSDIVMLGNSIDDTVLFHSTGGTDGGSYTALGNRRINAGGGAAYYDQIGKINGSGLLQPSWMANGGNVGFYGISPVARPSAYTQTYATASRTHPALTSLAAPAGGTGTAAGGWDTAGNRDLAITSINATRTDLDNLKQLVNSVIDDLQANGLLQ